MPTDSNNHKSLDAGRRKILKGGLTTLLAAPIVASAKTSSAKSLASELSVTSAPVSFSPSPGNPADISSLFETIKRKASPEQLYKFLYLMPKGGDIHHHLGEVFYHLCGMQSLLIRNAMVGSASLRVIGLLL